MLLYLGNKLTSGTIRSIDDLLTILKEGICSRWWIDNSIKDIFDGANSIPFYADGPWYSEWGSIAKLLMRRALRI